MKINFKTNKIMKQTAVEFISKGLFDILQEAENNNVLEVGTQNFKRYIEMFEKEAKEMEKQQKGYNEEEVEKLIRITYQETMRAMVDWFTNNKDKTPQDAESAISNYVYPRLAEKGIKFKKK